MTPKEIKEAIEGLALKIRGEWEGPEKNIAGEFRFASVRDALRQLRIFVKDGASVPSIADSDRLKRQAAFGYQTGSTDRSYEQVDHLLPVVQALELAYPEGGVLHPSACLAILFWRTVGGEKIDGGRSMEVTLRAARMYISKTIDADTVRRIVATGVSVLSHELRLRGLLSGGYYAVYGWDEIAAYLDVSERTAQRMEIEGLPVWRDGRFVGASIYEIDAWMGRRK